MHYFTFDINKYKAATAHLNNEEDLCYRRLLDMYYDTEAPIPNKTKWLAKRLRVGSETVISVLEDFFELQDDEWRHEVCDVIINQYHIRQEINSKNGKKGGRPKSESKPNGLQVVTESQPNRNQNETKPKGNHKSLINNHKSLINNTNKNHGQIDHDFDIFWKAYPNPKKKKEAIRLWNKYKPDLEKCLKAIEWQKDTEQWRVKGMIPLPTTWLNNAQWEDEPIKKIYRELG